MQITAVPRNYRRGLRWPAALAGAAALTAMTAVLASGSPPAQAAAAHSPADATQATISPYSQLNGVSAVSATGAWAAGYYQKGSDTTVTEPLVLRCTGTACNKVPTSSAPSGATYTELSGVSAISTTGAWAAGSYTNSIGASEPLLLRCTGTACKKVPSSALSSLTNASLSGVSADSATDAWAAGYYQNSSGTDEPLILHWTSKTKTWKKVPMSAPSGATYTELSGVSADSATDVWASGVYVTSSGAYEPLVMHWNGTAWKKVTSPAPTGAPDTVLYGVSAVSVTAAWASGTYVNSSGDPEPLILRCTDTGCKQVASPAPSTTDNELHEVSADSATGAWADGNYEPSGGGEVPLVLRCTGTACKQVASPGPSGATDGTWLYGVSADSATDAWAAGTSAYPNGSSNTDKTTILHCTSTLCKAVKSANGA